MRKFDVEEIRPKIFHFSFKDPVVACLHFMRFQELYESSFDEIKNNKFTFIQYMELYIKNNKENKKNNLLDFTYTSDWGGFNVPSNIFYKALELGHYDDFHEYDIQMMKAVNECKEVVGNDFYVIGSSGDVKTLQHEVAHGFWYLNKDYKKEMGNLINLLSKKEKSLMFKELKSMKYCDEVLEDETQAYLATGLTPELENIVDKKTQLKFRKVFNKYYKK